MPEPKFVPKPGQLDYTNIRYTPCVNVVVTNGGKVLLAKRADDRRLYPSFWGTIDGFMDNNKSIEEQALEELREEANILPKDIVELKRGQVVIIEAPEYNKTWLTIPVQATVRTIEFTLDWEATRAEWFEPKDIKKLHLVPSTLDVVGQFFPELLV